MEHGKTALIVGGTSGLGLEMAKLLSSSYDVFIVGRKDPEKDMRFLKLDIFSNSLGTDMDNLLESAPTVNLLVYAAGFYQEGKIDELSDSDISEMANVGLVAPALLLQRLLKKQRFLEGFIAITSTSQWTPRLLEPMYCATKAGFGMLASSLSMDARIKKTLVAGPGGMATKFWEKSGKDTSGMLDPSWVAKEIIDAYTGEFSYRFIRLLRNPARVEKVEDRQ